MMQDQKIRILLVDDHRRVHQAITEMMSFIDDMEVVAHASSGTEAVALCAQHQPDLVLMDVVMPEMDGIEATKRIIEAQPETKILALSSFKDHDTTRAMLQSGALGFILKESSIDDLENSIRAAIEGKAVLSPEVMNTLLQPAAASAPGPETNLSAREQEILQCFASGKTNAQIAAQLAISVSTVKFHLANTLQKLGVQTRAEALVIAAKNGLI